MAPSLVDFESPSPAAAVSKTATVHPFAPLSAAEIKHASDLVRAEWPDKTDVQFKVITLEEPAKADVIPVLEAEATGHTFSQLDRRAFVNYYLRNTVSAFGCVSYQTVSNVRTEQISRSVGQSVQGEG